MTEPDLCPGCGVDLAEVINGEVYSRRVGVVIHGVYDGVLLWRCPDCGKRWHRFPEDDPRRLLAERIGLVP